MTSLSWTSLSMRCLIVFRIRCSLTFPWWLSCTSLGHLSLPFLKVGFTMMNQRLSNELAITPVIIPHQGPWAYVYRMCLIIPWPDPLLPRVRLPCSRLSFWSLGPSTPEGWEAKKALSASEFPVFHNQVPHLIEQWAHILPSLVFITCVLKEVFLVFGCLRTI